MAQKLEAIRGGGGSVKVGTTGTISALMSRELESAKPAHTSISAYSTGDAASRRPKAGTSADEASSSSFRSRRGPEDSRRKHHCNGTPQIPMLIAYDHTTVDATPVRKKPVKKGHGVVEIVDIKCGIPDKAWVNPITHRLKKLSFSKLSDSSA